MTTFCPVINTFSNRRHKVIFCLNFYPQNNLQIFMIFTFDNIQNNKRIYLYIFLFFKGGILDAPKHLSLQITCLFYLQVAG